MASRTPRKTFAAPFVVTLAACGGKSAPPPQPPTPITTVEPAQPQPIAEPTAGEPTPATTPPIQANPPPPKVQPATYEQHWRVSKGGDGCLAMPQVSCPEPKNGGPRPTCNPPPPIKYACPTDVDVPFEIVLREGATECFVVPPPMKCPKGAMCNPPRPRKVDCPTR
ncbi:MAG TPA: hypothetical protein VFQ53_17155 [Kofleriaceae bacterium]|nr:hypothetical protein [Kofleriaceae bacterium]